MFSFSAFTLRHTAYNSHSATFKCENPHFDAFSLPHINVTFLYIHKHYACIQRISLTFCVQMSFRSRVRSSIGTSGSSSSSEESAGCMCLPSTVFFGRCDLRFGFWTSLSVSFVRYSAVYWPRMNYRAVIAMQCEHTLIILNPLHVQQSLAGFSCGAGKSPAF